MAVLPIHKYFIYNSDVCSVSEFTPSENEGGIYEVLRVVKGVPLFLEEHLERFYHSAEIAGKTIHFSQNQIKKLINLLISRNGVTAGNILVSCKINLKAYFIPHKYPSAEMYKNGVPCGILKAERQNPNAKVFQTSVREQANKLIQGKDFYEVLLIDHLGRITEGSRSNVFFVKNNTLITPPGNEVLLGITRKKTIALAKQLAIRFKEEDIYLDELEQYSATIITGTSPKVLPVSKVGFLTFDPKNEIIQKLIHAYDDLIRDYIKNYKQ